MVMKKQYCMHINKMKMRELQIAVITGPTGAIGVALCRLLAKNGVHVYAVVRPGSQRAERLSDIPNLEIVECGLEELDQLKHKMKDCYADAFFHLAWAKTVGAGRNDIDAQIRNIGYTIDAVRTAAVLGCTVFIGAGSQAEYGRVDHALAPDTPCFPENGYGMAKLCAGQMSRVECEKTGIDHIWPRFLSIYGPYDGEKALIPILINNCLKGEKTALTAGEQMWDYLYADDAAEALYRMALYGRSGAIYPVGSGTARPLKEYLEILRDEIDPSVMLGFGEVPYGEKQVMHLEADITAIREETGFEAKTDYISGIRSTISWVSEGKKGIHE